MTPLSEAELKTLQNTKLDLEEVQFEKTRGIMFRSKAKWDTEGEKNTKYFLNLEKARYNAKTCNVLIDERDGSEIKKSMEDSRKNSSIFIKNCTRMTQELIARYRTLLQRR